MLVGLDHVQLSIPAGGEDAARSYWVGLLGMVELTKPPVLAARGGAWFASPDGGLQIHVGVESGFTPARKAHPAIVVTDLDAVAAVLSAAGHPVRWDTDIPDVRRFHTDDPCGNRLEMVEPRAT